MAHRVGIFYNEDELQRLLSSDKMERMEQEIMMQKKGEIEAEFLHQFGVPGSFEVSIIRSSNHSWKGRRFAGRVIFRVKAADAKTGAILKANPKWLDKFTN